MTAASQDAVLQAADAYFPLAVDPSVDHSTSDPASRSWQGTLRRRTATVDAAAAAIAATAAVVTAWNTALPLSTLASTATVAAIGWAAGITWARRRDRGLAVDGLVRALPATGAAAAAFLASCVTIALLGAAMPLDVLLVPFAAGAAATLLGRLATRRWAQRQHAAGLGRRTVLVVGTSAQISALGPALTAMGDAIDVRGACVTDDYAEPEVLLDYEAHSQASVRTIAILGDGDRMPEVAESLGVDTVLLTSTPKGSDLSAMAWQLDQIGTTLSLLSSTNDIDDARVQREVIGSSTLVHIARPSYRGALKPVKRLVDVVASLLLLAVAGLPMLAIAAVIRLTSRGGALFAQERIGLGGKHFTMLKFRSMVADAEEQLPELQAQQDAGNAVMFKMKDDPRITRIGKLLRTTSLDELPQLINVLRGDMSLVGPRPPLPTELAQYDAVARRRFLVKPGITGLWQVSGRSDLTWEQTVRLDRRYVENWSMRRDATIVARTVQAMHKGAY